MTRIDAHTHLWRLARGDYGWLGPELRPIYRDFTLQDLAPLLAAADIVGTILVQAAPTEAETLFLLQIAAQAATVRGVVGWSDFDAVDGEARIEALAEQELLVGLRPMVQDIADDDWLLRSALAAKLAAMTRHHIVFDALVLPRHLTRLCRIVDRHPDLSFVLDHGAKPPLLTGAIELWLRDIASLALRHNVVCKLSGLVTEARPDWQPADLRLVVDHLCACFGPRRLMWGSDWPVVNLAGGYAQWMAATEILLASLSADERASVFGGTAGRVYLGARGRRAS